MSKYTTEVRYICETISGNNLLSGYSNINNIVDKASRKIFGDYPIFDEAYRKILERKILKHYFTREISEETVGLWMLRVNTKMNEVMPYYNKLYETELIKFNPLHDVDYYIQRTRNEQTEGELNSKNSGNTETKDNGTNNINTENKNSRVGKQTEQNKLNTVSDENTEGLKQENGKTVGNTNATTKGENDRTQRDLFSETPQGALKGVEEENYLTNARKITNGETKSENINTDNESTTNNIILSKNDTTTSGKTEQFNNAENREDTHQTGNSEETSIRNSKGVYKNERTDENNITTSEDYLEHIYGKQNTAMYSKIIKELRDSFINIDMMVIDNLSPLFFGLW